MLLFCAVAWGSAFYSSFALCCWGARSHLCCLFWLAVLPCTARVLGAAFYCSFALTWNALAGRAIIPLGPPILNMRAILATKAAKGGAPPASHAVEATPAAAPEVPAVTAEVPSATAPVVETAAETAAKVTA